MVSSELMLILKLIDMVALGLQLAPNVKDRFEKTRSLVEKMVAEGRDPTPDELAALDAETGDLIGRIERS